MKVTYILPLFLAFTVVCADGDPGDQPITSGRVNTMDKFSFQYGKIEAHIKLLRKRRKRGHPNHSVFATADYNLQDDFHVFTLIRNCHDNVHGLDYN